MSPSEMTLLALVAHKELPPYRRAITRIRMWYYSPGTLQNYFDRACVLFAKSGFFYREHNGAKIVTHPNGFQKELKYDYQDRETGWAEIVTAMDDFLAEHPLPEK